MAMKIFLHAFSRVITVVFNILDNLLLTFVTDGIIIRAIVENTHEIKILCKNISMITIFLSL